MGKGGRRPTLVVGRIAAFLQENGDFPPWCRSAGEGLVSIARGFRADQGQQTTAQATC